MPLLSTICIGVNLPAARTGEGRFRCSNPATGISPNIPKIRLHRKREAQTRCDRHHNHLAPTANGIFLNRRLQAAMESGWRRKHHPVSFFATNLDDDEIGLKILELRAMPASLALISKRASAANHSSGAG
jgi:hypothetical protein